MTTEKVVAQKKPPTEKVNEKVTSKLPKENEKV